MSLCLSCGFCCDGTLFNRVPLLDDERARLGPLLQVPPGRAHGVQPCPALEGTCCRVYAERPLTCRRYRCLLLEAHDADEVSLAGAEALVARGRELRETLARALEQPANGATVDLARRSALTGPALEALDALERHLTFHFLGQRARSR